MDSQTQPEVKTPEVKVQFPALDPLFFEVCRTAIQNTAWKRTLFPTVEKVEGQLTALENVVNQIKASGIPMSNPVEKLEDGVGLDVPVDPVPEAPVVEEVVPEEPVAEVPVEEKKN